MVENLSTAPTNLQRYKTLNRYRVHLRRLNAFLEERARKVHTLFEHSHDGSRDLYGRVEMVLREPIRILEPWITTVWLLDHENTYGVVMGAGNVLGDMEKAKRRAKRGTVRQLRKMFPHVKKVCVLWASGFGVGMWFADSCVWV